MLSSIASFAVIQPWALLLAAFTPLIAYAYLRRTSKKRELVSSLLIYRGLTKRNLRLKRVKLPPRFFLELLALLLIVVALAEPVLRRSGEDVAIVLDNSMSMQSREGSISRFVLAQRKLEEFANAQSPHSRFSIYLTSPQLSRLEPKWVAADAIPSLLQELRPSYASENIQGAIDEIGSSGEADRIVVVSDHAFETFHVSDRGGSMQAKVEGLSVGSPIQNISIVSFAEKAGTLSPDGRTVTASLAFSGTKSAQAEVSLYGASGRDMIRVSDEALLTKRVALDTDHLSEVSFTLPLSSDESSLFALRLKATTTQNGNAADDVAFLALEGKGTRGYLLVSPDAAPNALLGLDALPSLAFDGVTPQRYESFTAPELAGYRLIVFHNVAPTIPPKIPSLYILPPATNTVFPVANEIESPTISSWDEKNVITSYLDPALLTLNRALTFRSQNWTHRILNVEQGPILVAGESQGVRLAAIGMELLPFEGERTPSTSVLLLNLLGWLSGGEDLSKSSLTGMVISSTTFSSEIRTPTGEQRDIAQGERFVCDEPGFYTQLTTTNAQQGLRTRRMLTVNAFYPDESATFKISTVRLPDIAANSLKLSRRDEPIFTNLLWPVLVMLLLDLGLLVFRRNDARAA